jgi:hypothetical protein
MSPRATGLFAGVAMAGALILLAWVIAIGPEDRNPSTNRLHAWMRSRGGRRAVAAVVVLMALAILVLHLVKFSAE